MTSVETKIGVIVLNYNSGTATKKCVENLVKLHLTNLRIFVVDNQSTDNSIDILSSISGYTNVNLIESESNGGYAAGNNLGIKAAESVGCKYIVIMNSDIEFDEDFISPLAQQLEDDDKCAICSPALIREDGSKNIGKKIFLGRIKFQEELSPSAFDDVVEVPTIVGACFMVKSQAVNEVGLIPEQYFLNFEETEWCLRMTERGYSIKSLAKLGVRHQENGSIGKVSGMQVYFLRRNLVLFNQRMASKGLFLWLLIKLIPYSVAQSLKNFSIVPIESYIDGITGHNAYK